MGYRSIVESLEIRRLLAANLLADYDGIYPTESVQLGDTVYFAANDGVHGKELWQSDGSTDGTSLAVDIRRGGGSSNPANLTVLGDAILFFARGRDGAVGVWRSDGSADGTTRLAKLPDGLTISKTAVFNGKVYFVTRDSNATDDLWTSDGTAEGTSIVKQLSADLSGAVNWQFRTDMQTGSSRLIIHIGWRLFSTDGTASGTFELSTRSDAEDATKPVVIFNPPVEVNGTAVFMSGRHEYLEIWRTDGTTAGTQLLARTHGAGSGQFVESNGKLYFMIHPGGEQEKLWVSDGTPGGTHVVVNLPGSVHGMTVLPSGRLLFSIWHYNGTHELYTSDGTQVGTVALEQTRDGDAMGYYAAGNLFFYQVSLGSDQDTTNGEFQLWCTDGSPGGARFVANLSTHLGAPENVKFEVVDGKLVVTTPQKTLIFDPEKLGAAGGPAEGKTKLTDGVLRVFGTSGYDVIRISRSTDNPDRFVVNLNGATRSYAFSDVRKLIAYGYSGDDAIAFSDVNGIVAIRSRIAGGTGNDTLSAGSSRDTVIGNGGDDLLRGGRNDDLMAGGTGDDSILGSKGDDTATGDEGADSVIGGLGDDVISGGDDASDDQLDGGGGIDVIFGHAVYEIFYAGSQGEDPSGLDEILFMG